jgi:hypothetical protein
MDQHDVKQISSDGWVLPGLRFGWESCGMDEGETA